MYPFQNVELTDAPPEIIGYLARMDLLVEQLLLAGVRNIELSKEFGLDMRHEFFGPTWHKRKMRQGGIITNAPWLYDNDPEFSTLSEKAILRACDTNRRLGITDTVPEIAARLLRG